MKLFLLITLLGSSAFAVDTFDLTPACEAKLKTEAIAAEKSFLANQGETLASILSGEVYLSYYPNKPDVSITVRVADAKDGRTVDYRAKALKTDAADCKVSVRRIDSSACRYSSEGGADSLTEIAGVSFISGDNLLPDQELSELVQSQVKAFLGDTDPQADVPALIRGTDDEVLTTGTLQLPGGRTLDYMQAYGGDNQFGIFFEKGTTTPAGTNSDGSMCVTP